MVRPFCLALFMVSNAGACGPKSPVAELDSVSGTSTLDAGSSGAAEATGSQTAEAPTTTIGTGDIGESSGSNEPTDTGGPWPQDFPCEDARFVTIHGAGEFFKVLVNSRGHIYACGNVGTKLGSSGLVAEFEPSGAHVRDTVVALTDELGSGTVACDAVDADDRLPVLVGKGIATNDYHSELQTYAHDGVLAAQYVVNDMPYPFEPITLAVGFDGTSIFTGQDAANTFIVQKRDAAGDLLWDQFGTDVGFQPHSVSAAGHLVATTPPDGLLVVSGNDGAILWETTWPLSGPGLADINDAGEVALAVNIDDLELSVARFDAVGAPIGDTRFTIHDQFDRITDVAIDKAGEVAVSGYLQNPDQRTFVARLDAAGDLTASHVCDSPPMNGGYAVAIDDAGSVVVGARCSPRTGPRKTSSLRSIDGGPGRGCWSSCHRLPRRPHLARARG